jgi:hypothetical protein
MRALPGGSAVGGAEDNRRHSRVFLYGCTAGSANMILNIRYLACCMHTLLYLLIVKWLLHRVPLTQRERRCLLQTERVREKSDLDSVNGVVLRPGLGHLYISTHYTLAALSPKHNGIMNLALAMDNMRTKAIHSPLLATPCLLRSI